MKRRRSTSRRRKQRRQRREALLLATDPNQLRQIADNHELVQEKKDSGLDIKSERRKKRTRPDYTRETMRPIVCLAFVLPMLLLYEFGSLFSDQLSGKSGIDQWFAWLMNSIGAGHLVILPLLTAGVLLHWHHRINDNWQFKPTVLLVMLAESCCLGLTLYFAGNAIFQVISDSSATNSLAIAGATNVACWESTIAFIGCGVYEELIFRLLLLSGLIHIGKFYLGEMESRAFAMIVTSLIFAALHYDFFNPAGASFDAGGFLFRFFASLIFCILFLFRGFGIAVGTHAVYDVMTQL